MMLILNQQFQVKNQKKEEKEHVSLGSHVSTHILQLNASVLSVETDVHWEIDVSSFTHRKSVDIGVMGFAGEHQSNAGSDMVK